MKNKPKASRNNAIVVEKSAKIKRLHMELGKMTYEIAKLKEQVSIKVQRSNTIGQELEKLNG